jgi:hypothetical protein
MELNKWIKLSKSKFTIIDHLGNKYQFRFKFLDLEEN